MKTLQLPRQLVNQILKQAQTSPEEEVCGLIGGRDNRAESLYPVGNSAELKNVRYQMEPSEQIGAMREMREKSEQLIAIYHSHPHSPALPSATDLKEAEYPECAYLIISLNTQVVLEMSAFAINNGDSHPIELELD